MPLIYSQVAPSNSQATAPPRAMGPWGPGLFQLWSYWGNAFHLELEFVTRVFFLWIRSLTCGAACLTQGLVAHANACCGSQGANVITCAPPCRQEQASYHRSLQSASRTISWSSLAAMATGALATKTGHLNSHKEVTFVCVCYHYASFGWATLINALNM